MRATQDIEGGSPPGQRLAARRELDGAFESFAGGEAPFDPRPRRHPCIADGVRPATGQPAPRWSVDATSPADRASMKVPRGQR